ncbi:MAG: GMC family oxidoreductase N-terminal domain-containing protein [Thermoprotei archaeon]
MKLVLIFVERSIMVFKNVIKALIRSRVELKPNDIAYFDESLNKVLPFFTIKSKRFLELASFIVDIAPLLSRFKLFTMLSVDERRLWLNGLNPMSLTYNIVSMLDFIALALYSLNPMFQSSINYNRVERVTVASFGKTYSRMSASSRPKKFYDAVVVGSGAGGSTVAWYLSMKGHSVALFEAGNEPELEEFIVEYPLYRTLKYYWDNGLTFTWGSPLVHLPFGKVLGGTVTINSGTMFRVPNEVLSMWYKESGARINSEELSSAYRVVEEKLNIKLVPEHLLGGNAIVMRKGAEVLGLKHGPVKRPLGDCHGIGECAFGCPSNGKIDMRLGFLSEAVKHGLEVYTNAIVEKIIIVNGKARGVIVNIRGNKLRIDSNVVVISAGALNTPRLLVRSGVKNKNIGRNLHIHPAVGVIALMPYKVNGWIGTMQSYYVEDLLKDYKTLLLATFPPPGIGYSAGSIPLEELPQYQNMASIGVQVSDEGKGNIPERSLLGIANYNLINTDLEKIKQGIILAEEIFLAAGAQKVFLPLKHNVAVYNIAELKKSLESLDARMFKLSAYHPISTARISADEDIGVVDNDGRVYNIDNLYIADASIMPSTTIVNPQLTINALSILVAQSINKELA